jgi:hypothetical protein
MPAGLRNGSQASGQDMLWQLEITESAACRQVPSRDDHTGWVGADARLRTEISRFLAGPVEHCDERA